MSSEMDYVFQFIAGDCPTYFATSGSFDSPFYPSTYPANVNKCLGRIVGPVGSIIRLRFHGFDVEEAQDCQYDYVKVTHYLL